MASSFEALPPEMVQKCVEFLDFDLVSGDLKAVSKATRGVARRALTRGRWKPIRDVAAEGLAVCANVADAAWVKSRADQSRSHLGFCDPPPAAAGAVFREAWALDPSLVIEVICDWDRGSLGDDLHAPPFLPDVYVAVFLWIVEPYMDGLSRIVSASEATYLRVSREGTSSLGIGTFFPFSTLNQWMYAVDGGSLARERLEDSMPLVGSALEAWANPVLAAKFTRAYLFKLGYNEDMEMHNSTVRVWSSGWADRTKATIFCMWMARIVEELEEQYQNDLVEAQYESGAMDGYW